MGNILTLTPALTITREEIDRALAIMRIRIVKSKEGNSSVQVSG